VWTVDEARRFLEHLREAEDPLYAAYVLIVVLGLRRGEVLGLPGTVRISPGNSSGSPTSSPESVADSCTGRRPRRRTRPPLCRSLA
jgi:hypothetical protein